MSDSDDSDKDSLSVGSDANDIDAASKSTPQISVEDQLSKVREWLAVDRIQWKDIAEDDRKRLVGRTNASSQPTALHILAEERSFGKDDIVLQGMKELVEYLVKADKDSLLQVKEESGYTPIHTAINSRNRRMVKWICAAYDNIDEVLRQCGTKSKQNCIHLAICRAKAGNDSTARNLVSYASPETLIAGDEAGNTSLHLAVEYNKCLEGQIELVKAILEKSDYLAQDDPHHDCNKDHNSPYRHHLLTAALEEKKAALAADAAAEEPSSLKASTAEPSPVQDQRLKRPEAEPRQFAAGQKANMAATMAPSFSRKPGGSIDKPASGSRPRDKPETTQPAQTAQLPDSSVASKAVSNARHAEEIREFLKKYYLRSRGQEDALKILYGEDPMLEKAIYFDLSEYKALTTSDIGQHISILEFENILQYVDIPKIARPEQVVTPRTRESRARTTAQQGGDGRTDVPAVFEQLRKNGVKSILEVIVEDLEHPAHSDSAIEEALTGQNGEHNMEVEIWNWKKVDISPDVILKVAGGVTSVQLYWSGRNAVLRAWSEKDGLPKLKKLKHLVLHVQGGLLDPSKRVQSNINAFLDRLLRQIARVRAEGLVKALHEYVDKQARTGKKLQDGHHERLSETGKEFKEVLQTGLADSIFNACNTRMKLKSQDVQDKKEALSKAEEKIKRFFSSEKKKEMDSNVTSVAALFKEFSEARLRAKTWAKEIAEDMAPAHGDFIFEYFLPTGQHRINNSAVQSGHSNLEEHQNHEWIQCMMDFRQLLYNAEKGFLKDPGNARVLEKVVNETGGPITVALIDDGIELTEIHFEDMKPNGKSFFPKPAKKNSSKTTFFPWYYSERGHGTIMASQIHRIAPKANLYVLKLHDNYYGQTNKRNITMKSAARAIREAIRRKVHIISMSWTITPSSNESEAEQQDRKELEQAIVDASAAEILMFCSASDEGAKQNETLPIKAMSGSIFKIGGADANGNLYERVGDIAAVDYTLPGHLVPSEALADTARSKVQYSSGSSVATALAAGLAALILYCAQIRIARAHDDKATRDTAMKHFQFLRQHAKMKEVFNDLRSQSTTGKNLDVWKTFGKKVEDSNNIRNPDPYKLIDLVAGVASSLCHKF